MPLTSYSMLAIVTVDVALNQDSKKPSVHGAVIRKSSRLFSNALGQKLMDVS